MQYKLHFLPLMSMVTPSHQGLKSTFKHICYLEKSNKLGKELIMAESVMQVIQITKEYNEEIVLELPPTLGVREAHTDMYLMEHKYDPHYWCKARIKKISYPSRCQRTHCLGALTCVNETCPQWVNHKQNNDNHFDGSLRDPPAGDTCNKEENLHCHFCRKAPICIATCRCYITHVMAFDRSMTHVLIHHGKHLHGVKNGLNKAWVD